MSGSWKTMRRRGAGAKAQAAATSARPPPRQWQARLDASSVIRLQGWRVFDCPEPNLVRAERNGAAPSPNDHAEIRCGSLILATGARERFLPFPGWTLPNVMGAGGLD